MKKYIHTFFCLSIAVCISCEEVIDIELPNAKTHLIVEGGIWQHTDGLPHEQTIRLSESVDFFADENSTPVTNATVTVSDGTVEFNFNHASDGVYTATVAPESGKTYTLTIVNNGKTYTASGNMNDVVEIENMTLEYKDLTGDPFADGNKTGYVANFDVQDPAGIKNYYLIKLMVNGEPTFFADPGNRFNAIIDDQYFDGELLAGLEANNEYLAQPGDEVEVQFLNISKAQYDFYYALFTITGNNPLLGDSPPARLGSNIVNETTPGEVVLGFFQVAGLSVSVQAVPE